MELLAVALLGGVVALDGTSAGQFMLSRPLVAGAVTGWLLGYPAIGFLIGMILETYLLVSFPTGGSRFPEGGTATVVAVSAAAGSLGPGTIPISIAVGLLWGQLGGLSITALRKVNGRVVPEPSEGGVTPGGLLVVHLTTMGADFARGVAVTATGAIAARLAVGLLGESWPIGYGPSMGIVLIGALVSVGILLHDFGGFQKRRILFAAGFALTLLGTRLL